MRGTRQRPNSQHDPHASTPSAATASAVQQQRRKTFNCIIDDSALVAGVKRSTRNGIRQWVKNGQIRLFVPLHALEQLSRLKSVGNRYAEDVRETLQWLDHATSKFPDVVTLQGAEDHYEEWAEVERFAVPRTLFSEHDGMEDDDLEELPTGPIEDLTMSTLTLDDVMRKTPASSTPSNGSRPLSPSSMRSQRSSLSAMSPPTSPLKAASSPVRPVSQSTDTVSSSSATVPARLQPLFNYILWRVHQELDPVAALESFIFLCNDQSKVNFAKGFDIKTKRLEQLRDAIGREDRDFKNRQQFANRENATAEPATLSTSPSSSPEIEDEVLLRTPPKAPAAMLSKLAKQNPTQPNVIDPDAFGRNAHLTPIQEPVHSPRAPTTAPHLARGGGMPTSPSRGGHHPRANFRGGPRARANFGGPGRAGFVSNNRSNGAPPNGQIDPNSFVRPRGGGNAGRGGRKLWVPT